ncbi:hypothetical protein [Archaeoglobus sp.]
MKTLEKDEVREFVKLLFECCEELKSIFGDEYIGREILESYYNSLGNYDGIIVVKGERRLLGFAELKTSEIKRMLPTKPFLILGISKGIKARLLMSFFDKKPKRDEVYVRFIGVHPKLNCYEIGGTIVDSIINFAEKKGKGRITAWLPVESDLVDVCLERGFEIKRMLESSFAQKYLGKKYYYLLELRLR